MSSILYYSNYCENCKKILSMIAKSSLTEDIHFLPIDNRIKKDNGSTYIILNNGDEVILPPTINKVPALLQINKDYEVLFGNDILNLLKPALEIEKRKATPVSGEPVAFALGNVNYGVSSDQYSFWDQDSNDLSAKGNGGMRQIHHYSSLETNEVIETPPDNYTPDKIGDVSLEKLQQERENI